MELVSFEKYLGHKKLFSANRNYNDKEYSIIITTTIEVFMNFLKLSIEQRKLVEDYILYNASIKELKLSSTDAKALQESFILKRDPNNLINSIKEYLHNCNSIDEIVIEIIRSVHNSLLTLWSTNDYFNDKRLTKRLNDYLPLPLIGFNNIEALSFINEILLSFDIHIDIDKTYHELLRNYLIENGITNHPKLCAAIKATNNPYLTEEFNSVISSSYESIIRDMYDNWHYYDNNSAKVFLQVREDDEKKEGKK